jgi:hypothetical protein
MGISFKSIHKLAQAEVRDMSDRARRTPDGIVQEADLDGLPDIVQKYMRRSGVIGKPWVHTVKLGQRGRIRMGPSKPWMNLLAEQHYFTDPPGFVWDARVKKGPILSFSGRDKLFEGEGNMLIKAACFRVVDEKGEKLDQGSMMRYLSEMIWFPSAMLGSYIKWEGISENAAKATLTYGKKSVSGKFIFSKEGDVIDFQALRYKDTGKKGSLIPWHTPAIEYGEMGGYRIPVKASAAWTLDDTDFTYIEVEITSLAYNPEN